MYKIFCCLALVLCLGFVACKQNKDIAEVKNPNHKSRPESPKIKSIKKYGNSAPGGTDTLLQVEEFDKNGFKTKLLKYSTNGTLEYTIIYTNNDDGKPIKAVTKYADGSQDTETHTYNSDDKVIATDWTRSDGTSGRHEYKYDDYGNIIQWDWLERGQFVMSRLYPATYNDNGQILESFYKETRNNRDTQTYNHYQYTYDKDNRLISKLDMEGEIPQSLEEYIYDSLDNRIVEIYYAPDTMSSGTLSLLKKQFNTYNEYGELTQYSQAEGKGDMELRVRNTYNQYGQLVETVYEYAHGFTRREKYVYEYWK